MTSVKALYIYPLKGGRAVPRQSVLLRPTGFEWDRHWMAIDATGSFVSQRTHPKLARVQPEITEDTLVLHAEGLSPLELSLAQLGDSLPVKVWKDRCTGVDQGDEAAEWMSAALGDAMRIVRIAAPTDRNADPAFAGPEPTPVSFVDGYPILMVNQASLDDLNRRMPEPVPMDRFRPNIVVEGLTPFAEDRIAALRIGNVTLRLVKPCTRCVVTSTDQQTGERINNPLPVLRKFRFNRELLGVAFGENAIISAGVGHTIERGAACAARLDEASPA